MQALPPAPAFLPHALHPYPPLLLPEAPEAPLASGAFLLSSPSVPAGGSGARFGAAMPGEASPACIGLGTHSLAYGTAAPDEAAQGISNSAAAFPAGEANGSLGCAQG